VLHVITTVNRGGAENHLVQLARGQIEHGLCLAVAYLKGDGYWTRDLTNMGVDVHPLGLRRYCSLRPLTRLRACIQRFAPDLIHAHMPPAELYARAALVGMGHTPPLVITKHNDEPFYRGPGHRVLGRWLAGKARRVIAISDAVNRYSQRYLGLSQDKVVTIHYGIDATPYSHRDNAAIEALRQSWGCTAGCWVIGTVSRLAPQKALDILLRGYAIYRSRATRPSRLVIVGQGPQGAELRSLDQRLGIESEVIWAGFQEDIPQIMNALDLFALTSAYEGFGLVLIEAMSASKAVVATRVSAIPEVVVNGVTGRLCEPGNPEQVAGAFSFFEAERPRTEFGTAGRERVEACFTVERMVERTLQVYRECLV